MKMSIEASSKSSLLHVLVKGEFTPAGAQSTFLELARAIVLNQSEKVLFDGREITGDPTLIERFYYGEFVAENALKAVPRLEHGRDIPFAYVMREPVLDPGRLGETVAINRGMYVKAFASITEAIEWLERTSEPAIVEGDMAV